MKVFCILGDERVRYSKSPGLHSKIMKQYGIEAIYVPFPVTSDQLGQVSSGLKALNIAGANVTVPYKEKIIPYLDEVSEAAREIGAVNTIVRSGDRLIGDNTDFGGFMDCLRDLQWAPGKATVLVVGTGGVAKAILHALKKLKVKRILVSGRSLDKVHEVSKRFGAEAYSWDSLCGHTLDHSGDSYDKLEEIAVDLLINATSVSSCAESPTLRDDLQRLRIKRCKHVFDVNYGRSENLWMEWAQKVGATSIDGLSMLANQAQRSFLLWTGLDVEKNEFRRILESFH